MKSDQLSKPKLAPIASQRAKFSNLVLFERREKEFIAHQKKDKKYYLGIIGTNNGILMIIFIFILILNEIFF